MELVRPKVFVRSKTMEGGDKIERIEQRLAALETASTEKDTVIEELMLALDELRGQLGDLPTTAGEKLMDIAEKSRAQTDWGGADDLAPAGNPARGEMLYPFAVVYDPGEREWRAYGPDGVLYYNGSKVTFGRSGGNDVVRDYADWFTVSGSEGTHIYCKILGEKDSDSQTYRAVFAFDQDTSKIDNLDVLQVFPICRISKGPEDNQAVRMAGSVVAFGGGSGGGAVTSNNTTVTNVTRNNTEYVNVQVGYVQVGGWTLSVSQLEFIAAATAGSNTTVVAIKLDTRSPITSGTVLTLEKYSSMQALKSAQENLDYYIRPLLEIREEVTEVEEDGETRLERTLAWSEYLIPDVGIFEGVAQTQQGGNS